jgi:hypothetical protein
MDELVMLLTVIVKSDIFPSMGSKFLMSVRNRDLASQNAREEAL